MILHPVVSPSRHEDPDCPSWTIHVKTHQMDCSGNPNDPSTKYPPRDPRPSLLRSPDLGADDRQTAAFPTEGSTQCGCRPLAGWAAVSTGNPTGRRTEASSTVREKLKGTENGPSTVSARETRWWTSAVVNRRAGFARASLARSCVDPRMESGRQRCSWKEIGRRATAWCVEILEMLVGEAWLNWGRRRTSRT